MNKAVISIITVMLVLGALAGSYTLVHKDAEKQTKQRLEKVEDFKYYLDKGNKSIGEKMKQMDLVIIEPIEMQQTYITDAQKSGTLVYGYINALEGDKWNKELYSKFIDEDFYKDENGNLIYFEEWDSYMMDMTSPHYQEIMIEEIQKQVVDKGLEGVFLDTVGNIDSYLPASEQTQQNEGLEQFIKKFKQQFDISVAQNWGFYTLMNYTAPYVDFIMWEDFSFQTVGDDDWSLEMMKQLQKVRKEYGIQVMAIGFKDQVESKELAKRNGFKFVFNGAGSYYNEW